MTMDFHVLTDNGAVLLCTVEGGKVTIPGELPVVDSPDEIQAPNDEGAAAGDPGAQP